MEIGHLSRNAVQEPSFLCIRAPKSPEVSRPPLWHSEEPRCAFKGLGFEVSALIVRV